MVRMIIFYSRGLSFLPIPTNGHLSKQLKENNNAFTLRQSRSVSIENILALLFRRVRSLREAGVASLLTTFAVLVISVSLYLQAVSGASQGNLYPCSRWNSVVVATWTTERRQKRKNRNGVTRWNFGRVHLIPNLYHRRGSQHYTPSFGLFHVSRRAGFETNASKRAGLYFHYPRTSCLRKVRGATAGRIYPRRYVTEKRKVRSGIEEEKERSQKRKEARSLNYNADEN